MDFKDMIKKWKEGKNETVNEFQKGFNNEEEPEEEEEVQEDPWKKRKEALERIRARQK